MFPFTRKKIPFSALVLTGLLSGFCVGTVAETAEGESTVSEIEEIILGRRQDEGLAKTLSDTACHAFSPSHSSIALRSSPLPRDYFSEHTRRNGIGRPLTL